jgi:uncharacterized protein YbaR (Trm112 family)
MDIDPELLEILRCPRCRSPLENRPDRLVCKGADCGLRYSMRDGILVMLAAEAERPDARPGGSGVVGGTAPAAAAGPSGS